MFLWEIIENLDTSPENRDDIDITEIAQEVFDLGDVPYLTLPTAKAGGFLIKHPVKPLALAVGSVN